MTRAEPRESSFERVDQERRPPAPGSHRLATARDMALVLVAWAASWTIPILGLMAFGKLF